MKRKILAIILLLSLILNLFSCSKEEQKITKYYKTTLVQTGSINLEDNYVGYVESETKTQIGTKQGGLIQTIYVSEGDYINAGDIIAKIDSAESNVALNNQELMAEQLQTLKNAVSKSFNSQIDVTKSLENQININLEGANNILELSKNIKDKELDSISSQVETTKNSLETTKIELEQTRLVLDTKEKNLYSNGKNAITSSMIVDTNTIKYVDELLGVINPENDDKNDAFQDFLGARDSIQKNEVIREFKNIYTNFLDYKKIYENSILNKTSTNDEIEIVLKKGVDFNNSLRNFLKNLYETVDNSVSNEPNFSNSIISGHKDKISAFGRDIESALVSISGDYILGLKGLSESIDDFKNEKEKTLSLLQKKVEFANGNLDTISKNYEQALVGHNLKITDVETKAKEAKEKINEIKENKISIESNKIAKISELDLESQKINLNKELSLVSINNSVIRSPISGVVTKKFVEIGQVIVPSMPIVEISDTSDIKISFEVKDDILQKINLGNKVNVKVDSLDELKIGTIKTIYPTKNEITKKTKIAIKLDDSKDIKIGSTAKLYLSENSQNGIFIPNNAIIENYMIPGVYVMKNGKGEKYVEFRQIKILNQNNDFSLIDGVKIGEKIIIDGKENLFDGEIIE